MIAKNIGAGFLLAASGFCATDCTPKEAHASNPLSATPVLAELFTSEGCSSCPPADAVLADLEKQQPVNGALVIPLAFHVDYWNNLGWRDPFSSAKWTDRQRAYAASGDGSAYTPELVIDGRDSFVGSRGGRAQDAIAEAAKHPKASIVLGLHDAPGGKSIAVTIGALPSGATASDLYVAFVTPRATVNVTAGENGGRALDHTAIVKSFSKVAAVASGGGAFEIPVDTATGAKRAVVFVQERAGRGVVGVAMISL